METTTTIRSLFSAIKTLATVGELTVNNINQYGTTTDTSLIQIDEHKVTRQADNAITDYNFDEDHIYLQTFKQYYSVQYSLLKDRTVKDLRNSIINQLGMQNTGLSIWLVYAGKALEDDKLIIGQVGQDGYNIPAKSVISIVPKKRSAIAA